MSKKKIGLIALVLGALIVIVLLVVGYFITKTTKKDLEFFLNDTIEKTTMNINNSIHGASLKIENFTCKGLYQYKCVSKGILVNKGDKVIASAGPLSINIDNIGAHSLDISTDVSNIEIPGLLENLEQMISSRKTLPVKQTMNAIHELKPSSLHCNVSYKIIDKKSGELEQDQNCKIQSQNKTTYGFGVLSKIKDENFVNQSIFKTLLNYYDKAENTQDFDIAIQEIDMSLYSKDLKKILYPLLKALNSDSFKNSPEQNAYENAISNLMSPLKALSGLLIFSPNSPNTSKDILNGLEDLSLNKTDFLSIKVTPLNPDVYYPYSDGMMNFILKNYNLSNLNLLVTTTSNGK